VNQASNAAPSTYKVLLGTFWYPTCVGSYTVSDQRLWYPNGFCACSLDHNHFGSTRVIRVHPKLNIFIMSKIELRDLTIRTIPTKMSLLTTCVANLVLEVATDIHLASRVFLFLESSLSLQKTFVELDFRFLSKNWCHWFIETGATGFS